MTEEDVEGPLLLVVAAGRAPGEAGLVVAGRAVGDERPSALVVFGREKRLEWHLCISIERIAVRERELRALDDDMHELLLRQTPELEALEQRKLLQRDRARSPGAGLADG